MKTTGYATPAGRCEIHVNAPAAGFGSLAAGRKTAVVTDTTIRRLYPRLLAGRDVVALPPGERGKTLATVEALCAKFLKLGLDRSSFVVGIGGGVVCDIAGLAASVFMRGVPFGFVPTTLLAQADAAIGGKNGVNLDRYKNVVGLFNQPRFVLVDLDFLKTLPAREFRCGAAEIIKHASIASPSLFETLEKLPGEWASLKRRDLEAVVLRSIEIKAGIIEADEKEAGERRKLNFGHTLGHALERVGRFRHGEAVSVGMAMAAAISEARGLVSGQEVGRLKRLLGRAGLPVRPPSDPGPIVEAMRKDKKRRGRDVHFVLLSGLGRAEVREIPFRDLEEHVRDLCQHR
ncbi:MAG TPA: 3-dehydroquinate synthase [Candidatus Aminicenantes bacterium]|nr:3-dehydroquinate synthase [Candidatus Aminicenantes bacterium]